jgi:hypothetical protein
MATVIDIDANLLRRAHENFWIDQPDASVIGLDSKEQVLFTENRSWVGRLDFVRMRPAALREAVVIGDRLRGRVHKLRISLCNYRTARYLGDEAAFYEAAGVPADDIARGHILFSDGASFGDGAGFALPDHDEPTVVADVAAGASTIQMDGYLGRNIAVGAFFSINDFLYRVEANSDGAVTFNPPLRQAVTAGAQVDVTYPKVQVRLQDKADWRPFCEYFRNGQPMTVNVIEAFDR